MLDKYRITDSRYEERARVNARRVRAGWAAFLSEFDWEQFLTLTTDPSRYRRSSVERVSREVHRFCCELSYLSRRPVGWAYAIEGGGGSSLHAHVLVLDATVSARQAVLSGWRARSGLTHRRDVDDIRAATAYLCKCIGPNGEIVFADCLVAKREVPPLTT